MKTFTIPQAVPRHCTPGFSLIELLTVMAVVSVLAAVTIPALNGLKNGGDFSQGASDISSNLEMARAYAMSNNTYVYVGIQEVDGISPTSADGIGRLAVAVIASQDGTRPYANSPGALTTDVVQINKPLVYGSVHLASTGALSSSGNMTRPAAGVDLGSNTTNITFRWPLSATSAATAKYNFSRVIEFDPQGVARLQTSGTYSSSIPSYIEIPLVPAHGKVAVSTPVNEAAVQIQGITGAVRAYRP